MLYQSKNTSVLKHALMTSAGEWIKKLIASSEENEEIITDKENKRSLFNVNKPNNMIYDITENSILESLKSSKIACCNRDGSTTKDTDNLRHSLKTSSFGPMRLEDAMPILQDLIDDDEFYGVIASEENRRSSGKINLYHPMVAFHINENWESFKDLEFTYYVYSGEWNGKKYSATDKEKEEMNRKIEDILSLKSSGSVISKRTTYAMKNERGSEIDLNSNNQVTLDIRRRITSNLNFRIQATDNFYNPDGSVVTRTLNRNTYLIPVQILNDGLAYPYYGASICTVEGDHVRGIHITPMCSANLGSLGGSYLSSENSITRVSVCTGSHDARSTIGLKTLNHSNLSSPFWSNNLISGWEEWVLSSLQISKSIYSEIIEPIDTNIDENVDDEEDNRTEKEKFLILHPDGDWFKYLYDKSQVEPDEADISEAQLAALDITMDLAAVDGDTTGFPVMPSIVDATSVEPHGISLVVPETSTEGVSYVVNGSLDSTTGVTDE